MVEASGWTAWPPRRPEQPIFYPVLTEAYAERIAKEWNVRDFGIGYVTCFQVRREFLDRYQIHEVGGRELREYWIPAEDLDALNLNIVGKIELVSTHRMMP